VVTNDENKSYVSLPEHSQIITVGVIILLSSESKQSMFCFAAAGFWQNL
jgi:hypothetical protein